MTNTHLYVYILSIILSKPPIAKRYTFGVLLNQIPVSLVILAMVCHFVKHLSSAKILFFLHMATIFDSKSLGGTRSEACPRQALLTNLSGSVGRTLQLVQCAHIALTQGLLSGAEVPLQAEAYLLHQVVLLV